MYNQTPKGDVFINQKGYILLTNFSIKLRQIAVNVNLSQRRDPKFLFSDSFKVNFYKQTQI